MKSITEEMKQALLAPIPAEAVSQHPTKTFLSTIKAIYVTERLNDVFGVGAWSVKTELVEKVDKMVVVKVNFEIPEYGIYYECFGGNDNQDLGDAYKGATTDAITKIGSYLGIAIDVFKGKQTHDNKPATQSNNNNGMNKPNRVDFSHIKTLNTIDELNKWYKEVEPLLKSENQKKCLIGMCGERKEWILKNNNK